MAKLTNNGRNTRSTLPHKAGLIVYFFFVVTLASAQPFSQKIDSLIQKGTETLYQDFNATDSVFEIASQEIIKAGIDEHAAQLILLSHQRASAALFHSKMGIAKKYLADAYLTLGKYTSSLKDGADSLKAHTQVIEANYFYAVGSYANALETLNEAEAFFRKQKQTSAVCQTLFGILQFQASIFYLQGEHESAIDRYLASIGYYDCYRKSTTYPNYILVYRNISQAYLKMGNAQKARQFLFSAKANLDTCPTKSTDFTFRSHGLVLYNSIAEFYTTQGRIDSAKYYFRQALSFLKENVNYVSRVNEGLAKVAMAEKDFATAEKLFLQALSQTIQNRGEKHYLTSNLYRSISNLYREKGDAKNSLLFIQKALNSLSYTENADADDYLQNPPLSVLFTQKQTLITIHQKAALLVWQYERTKSKEFLEAARNTNQLAIQFLDSTRNEFSLDKDKVVLGEDAVKVYYTGLQVASEFYNLTKDPKYLSECFELMDKSRSAVLMDHIKLIKTFSDIPTELENRERELKVELSAAEQQLYSAEIKNEETSAKRQHLGEIKKAYTTLLNDIRRSAPNYYKLRIENKNLSLAEAEHMLAENEALIEYFLGDSMLYTMVIRPGQSKLYITRLDSLRPTVELVMNQFRLGVKMNDPASITRWNSRQHYLFQKLVEPWYASVATASRLIIVPHEVLNYLPFEMLPVDQSGRLVVNSFAISYASSASLLREQRNMKSEGNFFAGFNADYSNQKNLPNLAGASAEVRSIKDIFGFRSALFPAATAEDFRNKASQYQVIHLALHSLVNDERPMFSRLVFTRVDSAESEITANELYSMDLNAEIAVLSACETGLGKLHRGEGMMSLSRAFMYAGVPSTVISLWKVPDQSASILMTKFYKSLTSGVPKDDALRLAKLEFIEEHPEMSHPFFWAGFVVSGKTEPVSLSYFTDRELLIAGTLAIILVTVITGALRRRRKTTALTV
ncbi:MAG TPA: CHAT domain-containing tetratricopeptide repeat protein [Chryseosolibacter sp.]